MLFNLFKMLSLGDVLRIVRNACLESGTFSIVLHIIELRAAFVLELQLF